MDGEGNPAAEQKIRSYLHLPENGPSLYCFTRLDSTNAWLKRQALLGAPGGTAVIAASQSAGRGRLGRQFQSPAGKGLYLSVLLRPQLPPQALLSATGMAAVAVCDGVERASGVRPQIKWTNDLLLGGKKLCGILAETVFPGGEEPPALVIGVGVNVSQRREDFTDGVEEIATSLALEGCPADMHRLAAGLIESLHRMDTALGGKLSGWVDAYRRDCVTLGKEVRLLWSEGQERALALDVDDQFGLIVRRADGSQATVRTGEVSVRGLDGYVD